jgi:hypothetical protein
MGSKENWTPSIDRIGYAQAMAALFLIGPLCHARLCGECAELAPPVPSIFAGEKS